MGNPNRWILPPGYPLQPQSDLLDASMPPQITPPVPLPDPQENWWETPAAMKPYTSQRQEMIRKLQEDKLRRRQAANAALGTYGAQQNGMPPVPGMNDEVVRQQQQQAQQPQRRPTMWDLPAMRSTLPGAIIGGLLDMGKSAQSGQAPAWMAPQGTWLGNEQRALAKSFRPAAEATNGWDQAAALVKGAGEQTAAAQLPAAWEAFKARPALDTAAGLAMGAMGARMTPIMPRQLFNVLNLPMQAYEGVLGAVDNVMPKGAVGAGIRLMNPALNFTKAVSDFAQNYDDWGKLPPEQAYTNQLKRTFQWADGPTLEQRAQDWVSRLPEDYGAKYRAQRTGEGRNPLQEVAGLATGKETMTGVVGKRLNTLLGAADPAKHALQMSANISFSGEDARLRAVKRITTGEHWNTVINGMPMPGKDAFDDEREAFKTAYDDYVNSAGRIAYTTALSTGASERQAGQVARQAAMEADQIVKSTGVIPGEVNPIGEMVGQTLMSFSPLDPMAKVPLARLFGTARFEPKVSAKRSADWLDQVYEPAAKDAAGLTMQQRVAEATTGVPTGTQERAGKMAQKMEDPTANPVMKQAARWYLAYTKGRGYTEQTKAHIQDGHALNVLAELALRSRSVGELQENIGKFYATPDELVPAMGNMPISVRAEIARPVIAKLGDEILNLKSMQDLGAPVDFGQFMAEVSPLTARIARDVNGVKPFAERSGLEKLAHAQKAIMAEFFLRTPGYIFRNAMSDTVIAAQDGLLAREGYNDIIGHLDKLGIRPADVVGGKFGLEGEPSGGQPSIFNSERIPETVRTALKPIAKWQDLMGDKATQAENTRRVRAYYAAFTKLWPKQWKPAFDEATRAAMSPISPLLDSLEHAARTAGNEKELREAWQRIIQPAHAGDTFLPTQYLDKAGMSPDVVPQQMLVEMMGEVRNLAERGASEDEINAAFQRYEDAIVEQRNKAIANMGAVVHPRNDTAGMVEQDMKDFTNGLVKSAEDMARVGMISPTEMKDFADLVNNDLMPGETQIKDARTALWSAIQNIDDQTDIGKLMRLMQYTMNREYGERNNYRSTQGRLEMEMRARIDQIMQGKGGRAGKAQMMRAALDDYRKLNGENAKAMHGKVLDTHKWAAGVIPELLKNPDKWDELVGDRFKIEAGEASADWLMNQMRKSLDEGGLEGFQRDLTNNRFRIDVPRREAWRQAMAITKAEPQLTTDVLDTLLASERSVQDHAIQTVMKNRLLLNAKDGGRIGMPEYQKAVNENWTKHFDFAQHVYGDVSASRLQWVQVRKSPIAQGLRKLGYQDAEIADLLSGINSAHGRAAIDQALAGPSKAEAGVRAPDVTAEDMARSSAGVPPRMPQDAAPAPSTGSGQAARPQPQPFKATAEWQDVPAGVPMPPGLEYKMNLDTGTSQVRDPKAAPAVESVQPDVPRAQTDQPAMGTEPSPAATLPPQEPPIERPAPQPTSREAFTQHIREQFPDLPPAEHEAMQAVFDARANNWARRNGRTPEDYYARFRTAGGGVDLNQTVWHGSPYRFDRFNINRMSTGEGNQMYGAGHYFASLREVAESYRRSNRENGRGVLYKVDIPEDNQFLSWDKPLNEQPTAIQEAVKTAFEKISRWRWKSRSENGRYSIPSAEDLIGHNGEVLASIEEDYGGRQIAYTKINGEKKILGVFGKFSGAREEIETALANAGIDLMSDMGGMTGEDIYKELARLSDMRHEQTSMSQLEASRQLLGAGVAGIRYLDGSSRQEGEGTHNYVVFDNNAAKIQEALYQKQGPTIRGATSFDEQGRALIRGFKGADLGTLAEEAGHVFARDLEGEDAQTAAQFMGFKDADELNGLRDRFDAGQLSGDEEARYRAGEEKFARAWQEYLKDGSAPTEGLRRVFEQLKQMLVQVYAKMRGYLKDEMTPEMRGVFDRLLSEDMDTNKAPADVNEYIQNQTIPAGMDERQAVNWLADQAGNRARQMREQADSLTAGAEAELQTLMERRRGLPTALEVNNWITSRETGSKPKQRRGPTSGKLMNWLESGDPFDFSQKAELYPELKSRNAEGATGGEAQVWYDFLKEAQSVHSRIRDLKAGAVQRDEMARKAADAASGWARVAAEMESARDAVQRRPLAEAQLANEIRSSLADAGGDIDAILPRWLDYADANPAQSKLVLDTLQAMDKPMASEAPAMQDVQPAAAPQPEPQPIADLPSAETVTPDASPAPAAPEPAVSEAPADWTTRPDMGWYRNADGELVYTSAVDARLGGMRKMDDGYVEGEIGKMPADLTPDEITPYLSRSFAGADAEEAALKAPKQETSIAPAQKRKPLAVLPSETFGTIEVLRRTSAGEYEIRTKAGEMDIVNAAKLKQIAKGFDPAAIAREIILRQDSEGLSPATIGKDVIAQAEGRTLAVKNKGKAKQEPASGTLGTRVMALIEKAKQEQLTQDEPQPAGAAPAPFAESSQPELRDVVQSSMLGGVADVQESLAGQQAGMFGEKTARNLNELRREYNTLQRAMKAGGPQAANVEARLRDVLNQARAQGVDLETEAAAPAGGLFDQGAETPAQADLFSQHTTRIEQAADKLATTLESAVQRIEGALQPKPAEQPAPAIETPAQPEPQTPKPAEQVKQIIAAAQSGQLPVEQARAQIEQIAQGGRQVDETAPAQHRYKIGDVVKVTKDYRPIQLSEAEPTAKTLTVIGQEMADDGVPMYRAKDEDGKVRYFREDEAPAQPEQPATPEAPAMAQPDAMPAETAQPAQQLPAGVDAAEIARMDKQIQQLEERAANLQAKVNAPQQYPGAFETGRSKRSRSLDRKAAAETERWAQAGKEYRQVDAELKDLKRRRAAYAAGEVHANGQPRAAAPSAMKMRSYEERKADYLRAILKPGDLVTAGNGPMGVKRVNSKSITTESGTNFKYSEITLWEDGKPLPSKVFRDRKLEWEAQQPTQADAPAQQPPAEPPSLYQEFDPDTIRNQDEAVEKGQQEGIHYTDLTDAASQDALKGIRAIRDGFREHVKQAPLPRNVTPEQQAALGKELDKFIQQYYDTRRNTMEQAKSLTNFTLLDYGQKRGFDQMLGLIAPFSYWGTRQGRNYLIRFMSDPRLLTSYMRYRYAMEDQNKKDGVRGRFGAGIKIPLASVTGGKLWDVYVDPMMAFFPFAGLVQADMNDGNQDRTAFQEAYDKASMLGFRPSPMFDIPLRLSNAMVSKQPGEDGYNQEMAGYGAPSIGQLIPQTGAIQGLTAAAGIGGPTGVDIERPLRKLAGLPEGEQWDAYRIARSVADLAAYNQKQAGSQPFDSKPYLVAQEFIKAHGQTDLPSAIESYTPDKLAGEMQVPQDVAAMALQIAREGARMATQQRGFAQLASVLGGQRAQQLPEGEKARWAMRGQERAAAYSPLTDTGSRQAAQQVQQANPALAVQRAQYGALPGDEKDYRYLYDQAVRGEINAQFDALKDSVIQSKPWDRKAARQVENARYVALGTVQDRAAKDKPTGGDQWQREYQKAVAQLTGQGMPPETMQEYRPRSIAGASPAEALQIRKDEILRYVMNSAPDFETFQGDDGTADHEAYNAAKAEWTKKLATIAVGIPQVGQILAKADTEKQGGALRKWLATIGQSDLDAYRRRNDTPLEAAQRVYFEQVYQPAMQAFRDARDNGDPQAFENTIGKVGAVNGSALIPLIKEVYGDRFNEMELAQDVAQLKMPKMTEIMDAQKSPAAKAKSDAQEAFWNYIRDNTPPGSQGYQLRQQPLIAAALDPGSRRTLTAEQFKLALGMARGWVNENYGEAAPEMQQEWQAARAAKAQFDALVVGRYGRDGLAVLQKYERLRAGEDKLALRERNPALNDILMLRAQFAQANPVYAAYYRGAEKPVKKKRRQPVDAEMPA